MSSQDESFVKRKGTTDLGKDYEDFVLAVLILKFIQNEDIEQFYLSSNHDQFGAFDDIVIEAKEKSGNLLNYALQLKHVVEPGKGSFKNQLSGAKGNFSLQKYFEDFIKNPKDSYKYVLFTNHKFDIEDGAKLTLGNNLVIKVSRVEENFKIFDMKGNYFKFEVEDDQEDYRTFFKKFILFTNQPSVNEVKVEVLKTFQEKFKCDSALGEQFLQFVGEWSKSEGKKNKLDRNFLQEAISLLLLGPSIKRFTPGVANTKIEIFRRIISGFDIVFLGVEDLGLVQGIWGNPDHQLPDISTINKIGKKYKILLKPVANINDLDPIIKSKLLWIFDKTPVIVDNNETVSKAVDLCKKHKFIIIGGTPHNFSSRFKFFTKLTDIEDFSQIATNYFCKLKNHTQVTLEELLKRNPKIRSLITTSEILKMATDSFKMADVVNIVAHSDPEISKMCWEGFTPIHAASIIGDYSLIELISDSEIDINGASKDGDSPIFLATINNHPNIVKTLLKCGANPNAANSNGDTPIQVACTKNYNPLVQILGEGGANASAADKNGVTPLQVVASQGNLELVKLLLSFGATINGADVNGETALYLSCLNGHRDVVEVLLENGAKQITNIFGYAPLHAASMKGHHEIVKVLLEFGQNNQIDEIEDENEKIRQKLQSVRINCSNFEGDTPLHVACERGFLEVVKVLVKFGANVNACNASGASALDLAKKQQHYDIVSFLTSQ